MSAHWSSDDPTDCFTGLAETYARYRPGYPSAAIDLLLEGLGEPSALVAADVGAGTGVLSRQLAERGVRVLAVEPNDDMRRAAQPHPGVEQVTGRAEATGLEDGQVDLVACGNAFHWFEPEATLIEFSRILRPGGRVGLAWNLRRVETGLERAYDALLRELKPADRRDRPPGDAGAVLGTSPLLCDFREERVPHDVPVDAESLAGRTLSMSYAPREESERRRVRERAAELIAEHAGSHGRVGADGRTTIGYVARLQLARVVSPLVPSPRLHR